MFSLFSGMSNRANLICQFSIFSSFFYVVSRFFGGLFFVLFCVYFILFNFFFFFAIRTLSHENYPDPSKWTWFLSAWSGSPSAQAQVRYGFTRPSPASIMGQMAFVIAWNLYENGFPIIYICRLCLNTRNWCKSEK